MSTNASSPSLQGLRIRHVTKDDLIGLEWGGEYKHFRQIFADAYQASNRGAAVLWMAETNQQGIIGQVFISLLSSRHDLADGINRAYLYGFRILPAYRNLGVGKRMMHVVEMDLVKRGFRILTLNVGRDNIDAQRFYQRLGFHIVHQDPGRWSYLDHRGRRKYVNEPAWRMEKSLSGEE